MADYAPDVVLVELAIDCFKGTDPMAGLAAFFRTYDGPKTELYVSWQYCAKKNIPCLPYDIAGRNEFYEENDYNDREPRYYANLFDELKKANPLLYDVVDSVNALADSCTNGRPEALNSPLCDEIAKAKIDYWDRAETMIQVPDSEWAALDNDHWTRRNDSMAKTICDIAKRHSGQRILVPMGSYHRYYVRKLLREKCPAANVHEYWE